MVARRASAPTAPHPAVPRTAADVVAEALDERDAELAEAIYAVCDVDDVDALTALDFTAALGGQTAHLVGLARGAAATTVVLVGRIDAGVRELLHDELPDVDVLVLRDVESPAAALGYVGGIGPTWTTKDIAAKRRTWLELARGARVEVPAVTGSEEHVAFPLSAFPRSLRALIDEGSTAQNVHPAFFAVPLLPILAGAVGASRRVRVRPGWTEPCIVWAVTVAVSGSGKSPPLDVLLAPMREVDEELIRRSQVAHEQFKARLADWNRAQRRKDAGDTGAAPEPPPTLCALVDDVTTEALAVRLAANPRGVTLAADELATWLGSFDAYRGGRGGDEARWLGIYGARPLRVDRKVGGTLYVPSPHVSVAGGVQPRVAARVLGQAQRESGLAARLLLAAPPVGAALWTDAAIGEQTLDNYRRVVQSLADLALHDPPLCLPLSTEARAIFREAHDRLARNGAAAAADGDDDAAAVHAKLRSAVPRIALCLALAKAAESGIAELLREVDAEAMAGAIALGDYFAAEAGAIYASWRRASPDRQARIDARIMAALRQAPRSRTELRDLLQRNVPADELQGCLRRLADAGLVESESVPGVVGRPRETWRVVS